MELLDRYGVELEGAEAVVVGRSDLVGKPVAQMLLARNATVTICHSRTRDLPDVCRRADVLVAAVGRARMVQGDWVKPGATVIDVGINRTDDGLVGDVDFDAAAAARGAHHAGAARRRADDDRDAAAQHARGGPRPRGGAAPDGAAARRRPGSRARAASRCSRAVPRTGTRARARWQAFSVLDVVLALLALVPLALVVLQATRESPSLPVAFSVLTTVAGALATLLILYRILNQPGPNDRVEVELGAWIGLAARGRDGRRRLALAARRGDPGRAGAADRGPSRARSLTDALAPPPVGGSLMTRKGATVSTLGIVLMLARRRARGGGGARAVARRARRQRPPRRPPAGSRS